MSAIYSGEVPAFVGRYYEARFTIDQIEATERDLCLALLQHRGFECIAGAIGIGDRSASTVAGLTQEAAADSPGIADPDSQTNLLAGPHPHSRDGVGIWTMPVTPA